mgnify:CR=1 FL=1
MYNFKFADIGEGIHEGVILKWHFKIGDKVKEGDTLVVIETDKVNAEIPSPVDGIIKKLGANEGDTIHVGETLVLIDDGSGEEVEEIEEEVKTAEKPKEKGASVIGEIEVSEEVITSSYETKAKDIVRGKILATPVARKLAKDLGVDIQTIIGSGENNRVLKEDIYKAQEDVTAPIEVSGDVTYVPITKLRKAVVKAMTQAKKIIPHTVVMDEIVVDNLVDVRNRVKGQAAAENIKVTYMAFFIKAAVLALKKYPSFNATFDEMNDRMIYKNFYNIGLAVDTKDGLIVPNIKNADKMSILELAQTTRELADRTIDRKVQLPELQNATFTITNFGAIDMAYGTPIINYPEVAILGVGKIHKKPVVINNEIKISYVLPLSLAVDHRVIDGADAGRFLNYIKALLNDPMMLLLS